MDDSHKEKVLALAKQVVEELSKEKGDRQPEVGDVYLRESTYYMVAVAAPGRYHLTIIGNPTNSGHCWSSNMATKDTMTAIFGATGQQDFRYIGKANDIVQIQEEQTGSDGQDDYQEFFKKGKMRSFAQTTDKE